MKNTLRNSMLVVVLSIATLAMARANDFYLSVKSGDNRTVDLFVEQSNHPMSISFEDARGEILYNYDYKKLPSSAKRYKFDNLPNGTYFFVLEDDIKIERVPVVFTNTKTIVEREKGEIVYKPYFRKDNNVISVNILTIDQSPVSIKVYNERTNALVHEEVLKTGKSVGKRFDFSTIGAGSYRFEVVHNGSTFYKTVSL
ncbi:DUF3244 domain-containing protein [Galbibacter sp. BG1]|uniref:DUF3244 domain-containing protein n=1 Tax=Galbibacter sp. BG1 TaxID=1170699 RepID=UPI0015C11969|nr:DUF3244 domain-containing protein [Galbibacter sp. BG1]QLE01838.1 DUF3244 domain-containing protein [Galbibacter sp. BG1]